MVTVLLERFAVRPGDFARGPDLLLSGAEARRALPAAGSWWPASGGDAVITVVVADDEPLQRRGCRVLLESAPGITVVGEAEHGGQAVRMAAGLRPDVVVTEVRLSGVDGVEAIRRIVAAGGRTRVLVLTAAGQDRYAYDALCAGASGFLLKSDRPEELVAGVHAVAAGNAVVSPRLTRRLLDARAHDLLVAGARGAARLAALSGRERQVLVAIGSGRTNAEIAGELALTESTVKKHVSRVLAKIGARDRVQAVIIAYEARLIVPRP